jgi:hypothetical protein
MEEDDVEGREAAEACKRIQPGWLAVVHALLDVSEGQLLRASAKLLALRLKLLSIFESRLLLIGCR